MGKLRPLKIALLLLVSVSSVYLGYDFPGLTPGIVATWIVVFIGVFSGLFAMTLIKSIPLKCVVGVPVALNSIVLIYFSGLGCLYIYGVLFNA